MSSKKKFLRAAIRLIIRPNLTPHMPVSLARVFTNAIGRASPAVRGIAVEGIELASMKAERLAQTSGARTDVVILYVHGGAFRIGSAAMYRNLAAFLARSTNASVIVPDYRLAPEHPYPAAHDDALVAAVATLERYPGAKLVLAGDSAGGGLALRTAQRLRDAGELRVGGILLISPWLDLSMSGESATRLDRIDPMLSRDGLAFAARDYLRGVDPASPDVSPLFGSLVGLPRIHVELGSDEVLLDDSKRLEARCRSAGVAITVEITEGVWHDFPMHAGALPEADRSVARMAGFVERVAKG